MRIIKERFTKELLGLNRQAIRIIAGLILEHCKQNKHMTTTGLTEEVLCRVGKKKRKLQCMLCAAAKA